LPAEGHPVARVMRDPAFLSAHDAVSLAGRLTFATAGLGTISRHQPQED